ncbi:MAG: cytochrome ubiquinol oxidase subunit I [Actinomycetota bacterium]
MDLLMVAAERVAGALGEPSQSDLLAARQTQAMSFVFHIPLVCFGIAFPAMVLFTEGLWLRTGDPVYKALAQRWSKVMLILFAVGVVTGTILSFELGLLWPNFMATFGDVFGVAFALEGFSFFLEAIFIAIYVYGWDRLSPRHHFMVGIPIVITGLAGSLFVISVNAWMNDPTGFDLVGGEVTNVDPWAALFNSDLAFELTHMYLAGYMVAGFLVAGVYARSWLRGDRSPYNRAALIIPLTFAALATPAQLIVGDWTARSVAKDQPVKLASFEGLPKTERGAPFHIGGIYEDGEVKGGIEIPDLLSILADHDTDGKVEGLNSVQPDDRPSAINTVRLSFQAMVFIGTGLAGLAAFYLLVWWRRLRLPRSPWFFRAVVLAGPLALVALICGWITAEVGRQPWIVYELMRTEQAVTDAGGLWVAFALLAAVYLSLLAAVIWLLRRLARTSPEGEAAAPTEGAR